MADRLNKISQHLLKDTEEKRLSPLCANKTKAIARYTKADIIAKREAGECWIVLHGKVYDVTEFLEEHPGGAELITEIPADDISAMTERFDEEEHSEDAFDDLEPLFRGVFIPDGETDVSDELLAEAEELEAKIESEDEASDDGDSVVSEGSLIPELEGMMFGTRQEADLELIDSEYLSHDVVVFRFALPDQSDILGLPVGQHIILSFTQDDGQVITRPYTPVSPLGEEGFIDFLIKLYPNGKMSNHLLSLNHGDTIHMKGPKGHLIYYGAGQFKVKKVVRNLKKIGMIAGGSGITPMFQVIQQVASDPDADVELTLLFANKTEEDIILREQLEAFAQERGNIQVNFTVDNPPEEWEHNVGFITKEMIENTLPPPSDDTMIFLCGPPPMIKKACLPALAELGYERKKHFFSF